MVKPLSAHSLWALLSVLGVVAPVASSHAAEPEASTHAVPPTDSNVVIRAAALEALSKVGKLPVRPAGPRHSRLVRTGFRADKDKGVVLIHTSSPVALQVARESGKQFGPDAAVFILKGCSSTRRTDRLPLDTRYFNSSVTRVAVRRRGADLMVEIALRAPVTAVTRQEAGPSGTGLWVLEFPASVAQEPTATAVAAP